MTDYQRIKAVLEHYEVSAHQLSKEMGLKSPQVFYDIKAGKCGISKDLAQKLQEKFLNISPAWLLTGEGEMFASAVGDVNGNSNIINQGNIQGGVDNRQYYSDSPDVLKEKIDYLETLIREKEARIAEKDKQIAEKDKQIAEKDKQIAEKDKQIAGLISALTK